MNLPNDIVRQMNLILNEVAIKYATEGDYEKAILLLNRIIKIEVIRLLINVSIRMKGIQD